MNLKQIKSKLAEFDKSSTKGEAKKDIYFKPVIGKQQIRVIPNKYDPDGQFQKIKVYYGITNKVMASPSNWGEKDPIEDFIKKLRDANDKESWILSKKLEAKTRIYTPVIERGNEDEVRLWGFGVMVYQDFLNLADDEEIGDYTDVNDGRDIKLTTVGPDVTGTDYNKTTMSPSLTSSPASKDKKLVKYYLENQPNVLDTFKRYSYDEVKDALRKFLTPETEEEQNEDVTAVMPSHTQPNVAKSTAKKDVAKVEKYTKGTKSSNEDKFNKLFDEDEKEEETEDDLPF